MARATSSKSPTAGGTAAVKSASQRVAAQVIGRTPRWLRDHPDTPGRNEDKTYDLTVLVPAMIDAAQSTDLHGVSQKVAAKVTGKPAYFFRDHPEIAGRNADDSYDLAVLVPALLEGDGKASDQELKRQEVIARTRNQNAQAERTEQQAEVERGELIPLADVQASIAAILSASTERLMSIADKIAPGLPPEVRTDVVTVIREDTAKVLVALKEDLERKVL